MGIFHKNPLERIEKKDERATGHLERFVESIAKSFKEFKRILALNDIEQKDDALDELREKLESVQQEILVLIDDERKIEMVEMSEQRYATPQDDELLKDKTRELQHVKEVIQALIDILDENPNLAEYSSDLNDVAKEDLAEAERTFARLIQDDDKLMRIYKSLA